MKIKLFAARKIQYFELGSFSFNSYVYHLTCGFIASTGAFNPLTRAFILPTRAFSLPTRTFNLATRAFRLLTRAFDPLTRGFDFVTRGFELVTRNSYLVFYFSTLCRSLFFNKVAGHRRQTCNFIKKKNSGIGVFL